jgi:hypothetical protein
MDALAAAPVQMVDTSQLSLHFYEREHRIQATAQACRAMSELDARDRHVIATVLAAHPRLDVAIAIRACPRRWHGEPP